MSYRCLGCRADFDEEAKQCPRCGSPDVTRMVFLSSTTKASSGGWGKVTVTQHWSRLLEIADELLQAKEFGTAVIIAQTACEVVMTRALRELAKAAPPPSTPPTKKAKPKRSKGKPWIPPTSPANYSVRKEYERLAGSDKLEQLPFWNAYLHMVAERDEAVHQGAKVSESDARAGVDAAQKLVNHIAQHNRLT